MVVKARRQKGYAPVLEDWIWHAALPLVAYTVLFVAGLAMRRHPAPAVYLVGVTSLVLLYIGIHNAWDAAVWMANKRKES